MTALLIGCAALALTLFLTFRLPIRTQCDPVYEYVVYILSGISGMTLAVLSVKNHQWWSQSSLTFTMAEWGIFLILGIITVTTFAAVMRLFERIQMVSPWVRKVKGWSAAVIFIISHTTVMVVYTMAIYTGSVSFLFIVAIMLIGAILFTASLAINIFVSLFKET